MSNNKATVTNVPPYVSYRTLASFANEFKQGVPNRIDRSVMKNVSWSVQGQLMSALRYLGLIDDNDKTLEMFRRLALSEGTQRQEVLQEILQTSYPFLFSIEQDGFSLETATPAEFTEKIKGTGAKGDTIRKCELFFLHAANDAGITVSERIAPNTAGQHRQPTSRPKSSSNKRKSGSTGQSGEQKPPETQTVFTPPPNGKDPLDDLLADYAELMGFIRKLPRSKQWTKAKRDRWIRALTGMLDWEIEITDVEQIEGDDDYSE